MENTPNATRFLVAAGYTETAETPGLTAAGADPDVVLHTPSADLEILERGRPEASPVVPVSPSGCPTPAAVSHAAAERLELSVTAVDAGLGRPTSADTVDVSAEPGGDVRKMEAVPDAADVHEEARAVAAELEDDRLVVGESVPGGTTTALAVTKALGFEFDVSSSLPDNPLSLKREVAEEALEVSGLEPGELADRPLEALRYVGDPVLAAVAGAAEAALERDITVVFAGGTQMLAAAAVLRHRGIEEEVEIATTSYVAEDPSCSLREDARRLDVDINVTDPCFEASDVEGLRRYSEGEAKEGVGMGGLLALASEQDILDEVISEAEEVVERLNRMEAEA